MIERAWRGVSAAGCVRPFSGEAKGALEEVVDPGGGQHRGGDAPRRRGQQPQGHKRERGPRADAARAGHELADGVAHAATARVLGIVLGVLLDEGLAGPAADLLARDDLGEGEGGDPEGNDLPRGDRGLGAGAPARRRQHAGEEG